MNDQEKFEALKQQIVTTHEERYGREARQKYGDPMVDAAQNAVRNLTQEQYREWKELEEEIQRRLERVRHIHKPATPALERYAALVTSADQGAVLQLPREG